MSTTALLNAAARVLSAFLITFAIVTSSAVAAAILADASRYELVNVMPRATIVFDKRTGNAEQREPLPLFSEPREQPRPF